MKRKGNRRSGFTLLEALLATVISLMLLGGLYVVVDLQVNSTQNSRDAIAQATLARALMDRIARDLLSSITIKDPGPFRSGQLSYPTDDSSTTDDSATDPAAASASTTPAASGTGGMGAGGTGGTGGTGSGSKTGTSGTGTSGTKTGTTGGTGSKTGTGSTGGKTGTGTTGGKTGTTGGTTTGSKTGATGGSKTGTTTGSKTGSPGGTTTGSKTGTTGATAGGTKTGTSAGGGSSGSKSGSSGGGSGGGGSSGSGSGSGSGSDDSSSTTPGQKMMFIPGVVGYSDQITTYQAVPLNRVQLASAVGSDPATSAIPVTHCGIKRISYWVVGQGDQSEGLARYVTSMISTPESTDPNNLPTDTEDLIIAREVRSMKISYSDGSSGNWADNWDSRAVSYDSSTPQGPPRAIKIELEMLGADGKTIRHYSQVVAIPVGNTVPLLETVGSGN